VTTTVTIEAHCPADHEVLVEKVWCPIPGMIYTQQVRLPTKLAILQDGERYTAYCYGTDGIKVHERPRQ
jgi:hypothetical protein